MKTVRAILIAIPLFCACYSGSAAATPYVIEYSGTMQGGGGILGPLSSSFYDGEPFSGLISYDSSAGTTTSGGQYWTVGEVMTLSVGPILSITSPFSIWRTANEPASHEDYYYFDGYNLVGALQASGYTLRRNVILYQILHVQSFSTNLITTQSQIDALFPNWYLYMAFYEGSNYFQIFGHVTSMTLLAPTPAVPEPSTWAMMLIGFSGLGYAAYRRRAKATLEAGYA